MNIIVFLTIFIIGLIIGSFLNVLICRLPDIQSILKTRSHCPKCKTKLVYYDLIPLLSFVILSQKCRYCGKQISWQYPLVELATAVMFLALYWQFGFTLWSVFLFLISCFLTVIFVHDLFRQIILDEVIFPALVLTLLYLIFSPSLDIANKLIGASVGLAIVAIIYLLSKGKGMGFADIKLAALLGLIVGWPQVLLILFLAFLLGALIGLYLLATKKKTWKSAIAFGPFLIIGFYITLFWGEKILSWYLGW